jgi:hypothetical protein
MKVYHNHTVCDLNFEKSDYGTNDRLLNTAKYLPSLLLPNGKYQIYRCPRVAKKLHNLFVIKDTNFYFFLDDS